MAPITYANSKYLNLPIAEDSEEGSIEEHSNEIINTRIDHLNVQEPESQKLMELSLYSIVGFTSYEAFEGMGNHIRKEG